MVVVPCSLKNACAYVAKLHRHHDPPQGHKFSLAVVGDDGAVHGVAIVGRPVARMVDDGMTLEVTRLCADGTKNVSSMLLGAVRQAAKAMGYRKVLTYTLPEEGGASLRAAGYTHDGDGFGGGKWVHSGNERKNSHPLGSKSRWSVTFAGPPVSPVWPGAERTLFGGEHG